MTVCTMCKMSRDFIKPLALSLSLELKIYISYVYILT